MYKNIKTLTIFQLFFNLITYSIITPISKWLFKLSILSSGLRNLTEENFWVYVSHPWVIAIDLVIFFLITAVTLLYFNALVIFFIASKNDKSISIFSLIISMLKNSKAIFNYRNISLFLYVVFALPYINIVYKNPVITNLSIPPFMKDAIYNNWQYIAIFIVLTALILVYVIHNIYVFFFMLTKNQKYGVARKNSKLLVKTTSKQLRVAILKIILMALVTLGICVGFQYIFYGICTVINEGVLFKILTACFSVLTIINSTIYHIVTNVYGTYKFGDLYFEHEGPFDMEIDYEATYIIPKWIKGLIATSVIVILGYTGGLFFYNEMIPDVLVIAHRGASVEELENTKSAFMRAQLDGANIIELDVNLTKDNQVVVFHDSNLERLAKIDKSINELDYEDLKDITLSNADGSKTGQIMLLKDLLPLITPDVKLLIEIKSIDGNGIECAKITEKLLTFYPRHMIGCFDIKVLDSIKEKNPLRTTVYFLAFAFGNWDNFENVDIFALEQSFTNQKNVNIIHERNKKIFVWTINDSDDVHNFLELNVDGILTDVPTEVLEKVNGSQLEFQKQKLFDFFNVNI
jgi:glycerophosphoryl diester phosphodiesterase